jgi:hypothetical protein
MDLSKFKYKPSQKRKLERVEIPDFNMEQWKEDMASYKKKLYEAKYKDNRGCLCYKFDNCKQMFLQALDKKHRTNLLAQIKPADNKNETAKELAVKLEKAVTEVECLYKGLDDLIRKLRESDGVGHQHEYTLMPDLGQFLERSDIRPSTMLHPDYYI